MAGSAREAIEAGERALSSFEARGNRWWASRTLWHLTAAANYLGAWERSIDYCRRGLEHGIALQDLRFKAVGWSRMGLAYIQQGNLERGLQCCNEALALGPIPRDAAWARAIRGCGKIKARQADQGIAELSDALAWFERSHMRLTEVIAMVWLAEGHLLRGNRASARPLIENVLGTCQERAISLRGTGVLVDERMPRRRGAGCCRGLRREGNADFRARRCAKRSRQSHADPSGIAPARRRRRDGTAAARSSQTRSSVPSAPMANSPGSIRRWPRLLAALPYPSWPTQRRAKIPASVNRLTLSALSE